MSPRFGVVLIDLLKKFCFVHLLQTGDRILEVDGENLRSASHERAVEVIRKAGNPVTFVVQSLVDWVNIALLFYTLAS